MKLKPKISSLLFYSILSILIFQTCIIDITRLSGPQGTLNKPNTQIYLINKLAYRINLPFFKQKIYNWHKIKKNTVLYFKNKSGDNILAEIMFLPGELITIEHKREILPNNYLYVKLLSHTQNHLPNYGFVNKESVIGKVFFVLK